MISVTGELSSALATLYFKSSVSVSSLTLINFIGSDPLEFLLKVNFAPASPVLTLSFFAYFLPLRRPFFPPSQTSNEITGKSRLFPVCFA